MRQQVIILAERAGWRYISQCEHGAVHLVWDAIGIHLPAPAFVELASHILDTTFHLNGQAHPPHKGYCRLQAGRLAVEVPLQDFLPLSAMVSEALPQVNLLSGGLPCQQIQLTFPQLNLAPVLN